MFAAVAVSDNVVRKERLLRKVKVQLHKLAKIVKLSAICQIANIRKCFTVQGVLEGKRTEKSERGSYGLRR